MAHKVPVVTTDVGGMPEVMADTNAGFVCSKSDVIGFAESIIRILTNPALAVKMGHDGRKAFEERYSAAQMAKQYELLL
jgi:glycosyltransferase involved in cell wall biosynthesis